AFLLEVGHRLLSGAEVLARRLHRLDLGLPAGAVHRAGVVVQHALRLVRLGLPGGHVLLRLVQPLVPVRLALGALLVRRLLLLVRGRLVARRLLVVRLLGGVARRGALRRRLGIGAAAAVVAQVVLGVDLGGLLLVLFLGRVGRGLA